jgi:tetratricopeptide (TPR) repeat protein
LCVDEPDFSFQSHILSSVASRQATKGLISDALQISKNIADDIEREEALGAIVKAHLKNGDLHEAERLTETIKHAWVVKALSLIGIASAQAKSGEIESAEKYFAKALGVFEKGILDDRDRFGYRQLAVVTTLIEIHQLEKATKSAHLIQLSPIRAIALSEVADAWTKSGDTLTSKQLLTQAVQNAASNGDSLGWVAQSYAQMGDVTTALKIANDIPREFDRSRAYERIATIQAQNGEARSVLGWTADLKSPYLKSSALLGIAFGILQKYGLDVAISVL